jgi:chromosome segregation ATPase
MPRQTSAVSFTIMAAFLIVLSSCGSKEIERLKAENDSLRNELASRNKVLVVMSDVKGLLDAIDSSRHELRVELHEGTSYDNFTTRLKNINEYVKKTEEKISSITKEMKEAKHDASAYFMMMDALKDELAIRVKEVEDLEAAVEQIRTENKGLINTVKLQEQQMAEMKTQLLTRQQELALIEAKVKEMVVNFNVSEADALYARAKAVEEAANRTKLAPRKKKETYKEALELYKKALSLGKEEAKANITALEKKVK